MTLINNQDDGSTVEIKHFHLFCGLGGGARGFNRGHARVGTLKAKFRCLGGIDNDAAAIRDFDRLAGARGTVLDLFSREQYEAFHGEAPPVGWREATVSDIHRAANNEAPDIIFLSAPCKGVSGLLSETRSRTDKYQALNQLTLRGVWLALEAWRNDPPSLMVFENVRVSPIVAAACSTGSWHFFGHTDMPSPRRRMIAASLADWRRAASGFSWSPDT